MLVYANRDQPINLNGPRCYMARRCNFICTAFSKRYPCEADRNGIRDLFQNKYGRCWPECTSQPYCCPVNWEVLQLGKGVPGGKEPLKDAFWSKTEGAPRVTAVYDTKDIVAANQVEKFLTLFKKDRKAVNIVASEFCKKTKADGCNNNTEGKKNPQCTGLFSGNAEQTSICSRWYASAPDEEKELFLKAACPVNPEAPECECVNRTKDPGYLELKKFHPYPAHCFFIPCEDSINKLIPPSMLKDTVSNACPSGICQTIIEASNNGSVDISGIKSDIRCDFNNGSGGSGSGGGGSGGGGITPPEPPKPDGGTGSSSKRNKIIYIIVGSIIAVLVVVAVTYSTVKSGNAASLANLFNGGKDVLLNLQQKIKSGIKRPSKTFTTTTPYKKIKRGTDETFNSLFY